MRSPSRTPGPGHIRRKFVIFPIILSIFLPLVFPPPALSANVKSVEGIVQRVDGPVIQVRGRDYNTAGVPMRSPSGRDLSAGDLSTGRKVEMLFKGGVLKSIVIYENMVE